MAQAAPASHPRARRPARRLNPPAIGTFPAMVCPRSSATRDAGEEPNVKNNHRTENVTRESILKLLSDDEVSSVCTVETAPSLAANDEFVDLEQLERGVQKAQGAGPVMGTILPRKAVHEKTWSKILTALAAFSNLGAPSGK
jgi:hypothetical protein